VGIEFDNDRVDVGGLDDRRGGGGGFGFGGGLLPIGGGVGVVGVVFYVIVSLLGGGLSGLGGGSSSSGGVTGASGESSKELSERCNTAGAVEKDTDCRLIKVYDVANQTWSDEFARRGISFHTPQLAFFENSTSTGCGQASSQVGPFYCPADEEIYLDLGFLDQLQTQFGATGTFAQAYIVAHEYGHHLQNLLGTEQKVTAAEQQSPDQANEYSVGLELQADCYAGVWATLADKESNGIVLTSADIAEAQNAASAVGDDRIEKESGQSVNPETWTHGSAAQRKQWFTTGYQTGNLDDCNTFSALGL
jgi:predicted metalloprotease